jgi:sulfate transport system substrate-binding protein
VLAGSASGAAQKTTINLVAYSTPQPAYAKIIPGFETTKAGRDADFSQSYGASGDQARAVASGQPADVVALSLEPDVTSLVRKGLVPKTWTKNKYQGIVTHSVVVFVVRDGNPKHIKGWGDLVKPGVEVITPNPFTSGGARWNIMAAYGAQRRNGKTDKQAIAYLYKLFKHVPVQPKAARDALQVFAQGKGDVLLTYENEAIYANKKGVRTDYVIPHSTILIENPVALTKSGMRKPAARAFVNYLWSSTAQRMYGQQGYRPVLKKVAAPFHFPMPPGLFSITDKKLGLNGWKAVQYRFFDHEKGVMVKVEKSIGQ